MNEELLKSYEELKKNRNIINTIDPDFFFKIVDCLLKENEELRKENEELKNKINQLENMNEFQSKDIEKAVDYTFELNKEIEIKDQIIDLMSEMLNNHDIDEDICKQMGQKENCNEFTDKENCKNCIKQYFENKLKK